MPYGEPYLNRAEARFQVDLPLAPLVAANIAPLQRQPPLG